MTAGWGSSVCMWCNTLHGCRGPLRMLQAVWPGLVALVRVPLLGAL